MRILHHVPSIGRIWGGVDNLVADLVLAQQRKGLLPFIHCADDRSGLARAASLRPISRFVRSSPTRGPTSVGYTPSGEAWAASSSAAAYDIVHQHKIWTAFSRVTLSWARTHGRPVIIAPQGSLERRALGYSTWKKRLALWAYERENLAHASCLQATTEAELESFRRVGLRNPVAIIPNGISECWTSSFSDAAGFRASIKLPRSARVMLFLSRLHHKKGLHLLLEALDRLEDRMGDWHLVVVGPTDDAEYSRSLVDYVDNRRIATRVHFVGPRYGRTKRDAFAAAELFVLPTLSDNFAITIAEALGAGIPTLTTTGAIAWRNLETLGCGWCTEPRVEALTAAVADAFARPGGELHQMGERGKRFVNMHFHWGPIAEQCAQLYRWLAGRASKPAFVFCE